MKPNKDQLEYKVGRGHDSDIRVSDISVSRYHARIKFQEGKFMLEDNTSKFGTLVMIKDKTPIIKNHTCAIQSGRTVGKFLIKINCLSIKFKSHLEVFHIFCAIKYFYIQLLFTY